MMNAEESDMDELEVVPSHVFETQRVPSPVSALGGWATGAGSALFAVTKGVSSRVEGVSSRMSLRAKDMLSSMGDEDEGGGSVSNGYRTGNGNGTSVAGGILSENADTAEPSVDEHEALRLATTLSDSVQLAEKVVCMSKLSNVLGNDAGKASQNVLGSVAAPLVAVMRDAEHFDPFYANACISCLQNLLEAQGGELVVELIEAGATEAVFPLLHPRFELIRIECLAFLEALLLAEREKVCSRLVGVPTGMQALVDLLDDRWDEVRHQVVALLAAFLTEGQGVPPPLDLQNFVAFQEGFDKLFKAAGEMTDDKTSLLALAALTGALTRNPVSRKLFVAGGHVSRLSPLLAVLNPGEISDPSPVPPPPARAATSAGRLRWGWRGRDKGTVIAAESATGAAAVNGKENGNTAGGLKHGVSPAQTAWSPRDTSTAVSSSPSSPLSPHQMGGADAKAGRGERSGDVPVARVRAALWLVSALVGVRYNGGDDGFGVRVTGSEGGGMVEATETRTSTVDVAADNDLRDAIGRDGALLEAVCELALASSRAPVGGGPTWADYGLPVDCQRMAMRVLAALIARHPQNQTRLAACTIRGAPMSVTLHGRKQLVRAEPGNAVDSLLELWLAASLDLEEKSAASPAGTVEKETLIVEVAMLDRALDAFLRRNVSWCVAVMTGVATLHASRARQGDGSGTSPPTPTADSDEAWTLNGGADGSQTRNPTMQSEDDRSSTLVGGVPAMSHVVRRGLLAIHTPVSTAVTTAEARGRRHNSSGDVIKSRHAARMEGESRSMSAGNGAVAENSASGNGASSSNSSGGEEDNPIASSLSLRLLRRVLQAGGGEARALASGIGVATEGAGKRGREARARRGSGMQMGVAAGDNEGGYYDDFGTPILEGRGSGEGDEAGEDGYGAWGAEGGDVGGYEEGGVTCGPPLTPALEVAVRLFADGYNVAVTMQTGGSREAGGGESPSPPSDLTHYLVSLGELLVTWLSSPAAGAALARRLLASGANWALLRTFGRAISPAATRISAARESSPIQRGNGRNQAPATTPTGDFWEKWSLAYLNALVAVTLGSFLSAAEGLTRGTLSAGIARHVGLFRFCRALDSASDWIAYAEPTSLAKGRGGGGDIPRFWALAGESDFTKGMGGVIQAAQAAMINIIAGVPRAALPARGEQVSGTSWSTKASHDNGGRIAECEELLKRQRARIEELEKRLSPRANGSDGSTLEAADVDADGNHLRTPPPVEATCPDSGFPTMTI